MKTLCIYHDVDFDGLLSREVVRHFTNCATAGWDYGRPAPDVSGYDRIYIVDLSVDELMARPELRDKIVWIDHHKSATEKWKDVPFEGLRRDGTAACRLCWEFFTTLPEPRLLTLAGQFDVWDHRDPDGKPLQFGLKACSGQEFARLVWEQFNATPEGDHLLQSVIDAGNVVKGYCDKQSAEYAAKHAHTIHWEGLCWCALNVGQRGNSDLLLGGVKPEHQALLAWRFDGEKACVSLYHAPGHEDLDLSGIAKRYGGGGNRGACGFRIHLGALSAILTNA